MSTKAWLGGFAALILFLPSFLTEKGGDDAWFYLFVFWCFAPAILHGCRLVVAMLRLIKSLALAALFSRRT